MENILIGLFCLSPFLIFAAGVWVGRMVGTGRLRSPIAPVSEATQTKQKRQAGKAPVWEP